MVSPTAAAQAAKGHVTRTTSTIACTTTDKPLTAKTRAQARARARQRRSSAEQKRKMVRFSADTKTEDMEEGTSTGLTFVTRL